MSKEEEIPKRARAHKGKVVDREEFQNQLGLYYQDYGWDMEGIPTKETLIKLGMEDVYRELERSDVYTI